MDIEKRIKKIDESKIDRAREEAERQMRETKVYFNLLRVIINSPCSL